jgi:hypothetical protein
MIERNNRANLIKLLGLIENLMRLEENQWFYDELSLLVTKKIKSQSDAGFMAAITFKEYGSISRYIEQGAIPLIDFSMIGDLGTREHLYRDCAEMMKVRLENLDSKLNFRSYCKFAHFQAEGLMSYFLKATFGSKKEAVQTLGVQSTKQYIPYSKWTFAIKEFYKSSDPGINQLALHLNIISNIRNLESHRGSSDMDKATRVFLELEDYDLVNREIIRWRDFIVKTRDQKILDSQIVTEF